MSGLRGFGRSNRIVSLDAQTSYNRIVEHPELIAMGPLLYFRNHKPYALDWPWIRPEEIKEEPSETEGVLHIC